MPLLSLNNLSFTYSKPNLLEGITLHIERGERIGLVGRNGAGKSTLMKLISGLLHPDDGSVDLQAEAVIARLDQEVPQGGDLTAYEVAAEGFGKLGKAIANYRNIGRNWEITPQLTGARIKVPVAFIAGVDDIVIRGAKEDALRAQMSRVADDLRAVKLVPGAGHWIQQEKPDEVNAFMLDFLKGLKK